MRDLQSGWAMWAKAILFLSIGVIASALILAELPTFRVFALLVLAIWSFCRVYYFAFYVIEKYLDPSFRFSGLFSVARYLWTQGSTAKSTPLKETKGR